MKDAEINSLLKASNFKQGHPECTLEKRDIAPNGTETENWYPNRKTKARPLFLILYKNYMLKNYSTIWNFENTSKNRQNTSKCCIGNYE